MKINYQLKPKGIFWKLIPWSSVTAQAIYPNIYFPEFIYENLISNHAKLKYLALLEHEKSHIESQKRLGLIKFGFMYLFNSSFRFNEELDAYKVQMKKLKGSNQKFPTKKIAGYLSGPMYLWSTSYKIALKRLHCNL